MKCFTEVVYLLVASNILDCSYAYNMPISEASYRFIHLVFSIHSSENDRMCLPSPTVPHLNFSITYKGNVELQVEITKICRRGFGS